MYKPKITIIMAVYNRVDKIEQCISSVINQIYDNLEYIIIDGGSTDGTVDIIKKYDDKIAYWCSEPDKGIYDAWNKGLAHATGDYINFIGSDDAMYGYSAMTNIVVHLNENVDVLAGNIVLVYEQNGFEILMNNNQVKSKTYYRGGCILTQGTLIKRTLFNKYKFDTSYKVAADYKFFLQYYYDNTVRIKFVDDVIQYFSDGGVSSIELNFAKMEDNKIYKELGLDEFVDCHLSESESVFRGKMKEYCKRLGVFDLIQRIYRPYIKGDWKKHHCTNKICRWCGRYE